MMTTNRTPGTSTRWGTSHPLEYYRTPEASWYEVAFSYALKVVAGMTVLAAGAAVGLVVYYAL